MTTTAPAASTPSSRRWLALALIAAAQFMVIMDTSIIGVALPKMQADLGFDPQDLSWVFNAYVVAFGGLLLLGGRRADAPVRSSAAIAFVGGRSVFRCFPAHSGTCNATASGQRQDSRRPHRLP